jgi:cob(I)alamin adenosyltransferase
VIRLAREATIDPDAIIFLNRLSDLLFVWARLANHRAGVPDMPWEHENRRASRND